MFDSTFSACGCPLCAAGGTNTFQFTQGLTSQGVQASPTAGSYSVYVNALISGYQWNSSTITYSFPDQAEGYTSGTNFGYGSTYGFGDEADYFVALPQDLWAAADFALSAYLGGSAQAQFSVSGFTNLNVQWTEDHSDSTHIRIAQSDTPLSDDAGAWAYLPGNYSEAGDVWFLSELSNFAAGSWEWSTMIHELGHALGLKHPHDEAPYMPLDMDGMEYTIMSYRSVTSGWLSLTAETWGYAQSWMMLDIAALQAMYGADFTPNDGEVVYSWTPDSGNTYVNGEVAIAPGANRIFATIWDGGGNVTYDLSAYDTGVQIDMRPGESSTFSEAQLANLGQGEFASGNIYNGLLYDDDPRSLIHKVIGGSGDDHITSNAADNIIFAGGGNDTITLNGGDNIVWAGSGNDYTVIQGNGDNRVGGGIGNDTIIVDGDGANTLYGGADDDEIWLNGNGDNIAWGGLGADMIVVNGDGDNRIGAGAGSDTIEVNGHGDNTVFGGIGQGANTIEITGNGDNLIYGGNSAGTAGNAITIDGNGANEVWNGTGNDTVVLTSAATGANTLMGGAGDDEFIFQAGASGTVKFSAGDGNDTISGFDLAADQFIDVSGLFGSVAAVQGALSSGGAGISVLTVAPGQSITIDVALNDLLATPVADWLIV